MLIAPSELASCCCTSFRSVTHCPMLFSIFMYAAPPFDIELSMWSRRTGRTCKEIELIGKVICLTFISLMEIFYLNCFRKSKKYIIILGVFIAII
jgi:hypothetical protein